MHRENEKRQNQLNYLNDIDISIRLLETLKTNYISPGTHNKINKNKITRVRLIISDLLKKYRVIKW